MECNNHPKAPHGFNRQASHEADEYVCECAGWEPYDAGFNDGYKLALSKLGEDKKLEGYLVVGEGKFGKFSIGMHRTDDGQGTYWRNRGYSLIPFYVDNSDVEDWNYLESDNA